MNRQHESGSRLDAAIDRAVQRMMSPEPPAGFRRRVLARLDDPQPATAVWTRWGMAATAIAAGVLAVVLVRPAAPPAAPDTVPMVADRTTDPVPAAPDVPSVATPVAGQPVTPVTPERRVARVEALPAPPRVDAVFGEPDGRVMAASVEPLPAIELSREEDAAALTGIDPIQVAEIVIPPLTVPPVTLLPLPIQKQLP